jgi:transposase-like protein
MFFRGVSEEAVGRVAEPLLGVRPSASTISRIAHNLEEQCAAWRSRPLQKRYLAVYLDGVYFSVMHEEKAEKQPVLIVLGVDLEGRKEVLGIYPAAEESTDSYTAVFEDLRKRGVEQIDLLVSDGHPGLIRAFAEVFPMSRRQRCLTHKIRNVLCRISKKDKKAVAAALKEILGQETEEDSRERLAAFVERYRITYPEAVKSLLEDIDACFTFFQFGDAAYQRHIRSTNCLEGLFNTIRLRTNKMAAFRNETSCLLMLYAIIQTVRFRKIQVPDSILHKD